MFSDYFHADPSLALLTDHYQLTMGYGYWKNNMADRRAEFHMFFRKNPFQGGFVVFAGLGTLAEFMREFRFSQGDLDYLSTLKNPAGHTLFEEDFLRYLQDMEFSCDVLAAPEGTLVFPNEPLVCVQGPILQVQILETLLLNTLNFQSLIATKAARVCIAAKGDPVVDFGLRRAQGLACMATSRATYIGGCTGTSNVLAGKLMGVPVAGTHAHSWVMSFPSEPQAFAAFANTMPDNCVFLVDTYSTINGLQHAISAAQKLREQGHQFIGIRLDSGDLAYFSKLARLMLDQAGFTDARIMASNELDEYVITSLKTQGAQINSWGVGTKLATAYDDPALSGVYKLSAIQGEQGGWEYKMKLSEQKTKMSIPGLLQVYRYQDSDGKIAADAIALRDESASKIKQIIDPNDNLHRKRLQRLNQSEPLLKPLFEQGQQVTKTPALSTIRERVQQQLSLLDDSHKRFEYPHIYPVGLSPQLNQLRDEMIQRERERFA